MDVLFSVTDKDRELYNLYSRMNTNELLDLKRTDHIYRIAVFERVNDKGNTKSFAEMTTSGILPILASFPDFETALEFIESFKPGFRYTKYFANMTNTQLQITQNGNTTTYSLGKYYYAKSENVEAWYKNNVKHNEYGPALIEYYPGTDKIHKAFYYKDGNIYNKNGPTSILYNKDGSMQEYYLNGIYEEVKYYKKGVLDEIKHFKKGVLYKENGPAHIEFYNNGRVKSETYIHIHGSKHREDGPAYIEYHNNGNIKTEIYYRYGSKHREDGPAYIEYYEDGTVRSEIYYRDDKHHRIDGPAVRYYNTNGDISWTAYYQKGKYHREDGPAYIMPGDNGELYKIYYYINGELHRLDGPASLEYNNGILEYEQYYVNGNPHRVDGPAKIRYYDDGKILSEQYYINGITYREGGPAYIEYRENGKIMKVQFTNKQGIAHNDNGPAIIVYDDMGRITESDYYVNGRYIKKSHFL